MTINRTSYPLALIFLKNARRKTLAGSAYFVNSKSTLNYRKDSPKGPSLW